MSDTVVSFSASDVDREKLRRILSRHVAYDHARSLRGSVLVRMVMVTAFDVALWSSRLIPAAAFWGVLGAAALAVAVALLREARARGSFDREVSGVDVRLERMSHGSIQTD